jgi:exopolysaccharide biosynthesis protein
LSACSGELSASRSAAVQRQAGTSNPRTAIGQIRDDQYIFVSSDGRTSESAGLSVYELASVFIEYGARFAYNLDGGGSATMWFNGRLINKPTNSGSTISERSISDIIYIGYDL